MNKEYFYIDENIIVEDENGNKILRENTNNIEEILKQENVIEILENKLKELEEMLSSYKISKKKKFFPWATITVIIGGIVMTYICSNIFYPGITIDTIFGTIDKSVAIASLVIPLSIPLSTFVDLIYYHDYKESLKEEKGIENEINFVKQELQKSREVLFNLENEQKMVHEESKFKTTKIDNLALLKKLKGDLELLHTLGYNENKYIKYYLKGTIDDILKLDNYNDEQIEMAHSYLEDRAKTLTKKRK